VPILPPFFPFRRMKRPLFYRMTCRKCGLTKEYELIRADVVRNTPDAPQGPEIVEKLPAVCPVCGAPLKKEEIPAMLKF